MGILHKLFGAKEHERTARFPKQRIAAFTAVLDTNIGNAKELQELCETLLDMKDANFDDSPRRFFNDNETWCGTWSDEELVATIRRVLDDTATGPHITKVVEAMTSLRRASNVEFLPEAMRFHVYQEAMGISCASIMVLENRPVSPTSILKCRVCGETFDFATNADVVTMQNLFEFLDSAGAEVIGKRDQGRPTPDLVGRTPTGRAGGLPSEILNALRSGSRRRWYHQGCDAVLGYPGALFRSDLHSAASPKR